PLLQLDAAAGLLEVGLELLGLLAVEALLDRLRRLVHERLRLLEAEAGHGAHDLDHLDLLVAGRVQDHVNRGVALLGTGAVGTRWGTGRRGGRSHGRGRNAELLLERLDPLGQLEYRNAL